MAYRDEEADEEGLDERELPDEADQDERDDDDVETVPCPECGKPVYEEADVCPHCGSFILRDVRAGRPRWVLATALILLGALALGLVGWAVWY
jgi:DNA-directed RNA polymerase subunit RPC12/RpoP